MITVYRANWSTNCERASLALGHKGLAAESVLIEYSDRSLVERVSGQGLVPVIVEGDSVVSDSVAIIRWLERRVPEPALLPTEPARRAELDVFIEWFEWVYKLAPNLIEAELEKADPEAARVEELGAVMRARLETFERLLDGREHLLGQFGAADCIAYPFLKYAAGRDPADEELFHRVLDEHQTHEGHPRLAEWIERIGERPRAYPL